MTVMTQHDYFNWLRGLMDQVDGHSASMHEAINKDLKQCLDAIPLDPPQVDTLLGAVADLKALDDVKFRFFGYLVYAYLFQRNSDWVSQLLIHDPETAVSCLPMLEAEKSDLMWEAAKKLGGSAEFHTLKHLMYKAIRKAVYSRDAQALEELLAQSQYRHHWNKPENDSNAYEPQIPLFHILLHCPDPGVELNHLRCVVGLIVQSGVDIDRRDKFMEGSWWPPALHWACVHLNGKGPGQEHWLESFITVLLEQGANWEGLEPTHNRGYQFISNHPIVLSQTKREQLNEIVQGKASPRKERPHF